MRGVSVDSEMIHHNSPADNEDEERGTKHIELHFVTVEVLDTVPGKMIESFPRILTASFLL